MESAVAQLSRKKKTTRDEAIHEARKSIKKIRALLRLVSGELGDKYPAENARFRDIARRLSDFRDAFALVATFDDLKKRFGDQTKNRLRSVRAGLTRKRTESSREENVSTVLDAAAAALGKAARGVKAWPLSTDGYPAIGPGLEKTYRAGRKALLRVQKNPHPDNFHDLRKRVKDHWYHIRLLECLWTDVMMAYEKSLKDLETWLGNDHNLAVLREKIVAEPAFYGKPADVDLTLQLIDKYQSELRGMAVVSAERIYIQKPREFSRRMEQLWDTWRHEPQPREQPPTAA